MSLSTWPIGQKWNMPRGAFIGSVPGTIGHVLHVVSRILGHVRSWRHRKGVLTHVRMKWSFADPPQATSVCQWDPHTQSENVLNAFKCRVRKRNSSQRFMQIYAGSIRCRSGGTNPLEEWHTSMSPWLTKFPGSWPGPTFYTGHHNIGSFISFLFVQTPFSLTCWQNRPFLLETTPFSVPCGVLHSHHWPEDELLLAAGRRPQEVVPKATSTWLCFHTCRTGFWAANLSQTWQCDIFWAYSKKTKLAMQNMFVSGLHHPEKQLDISQHFGARSPQNYWWTQSMRL